MTMWMPEVCSASARAPTAYRILLRANNRSSGLSSFHRRPAVALIALLICLSCPLCSQGLRLRVPWFPDGCPPPLPSADDCPPPPPPVPTTAGHAFGQLLRAVLEVLPELWRQSIIGRPGAILFALLMAKLGWAETDEQVFRRRLTTVTSVSEPEVDGDLIQRQRLKDEFLHIVDTLKMSVLVWGSHKTGKSTLVQTIMAEQSKKGRPILYFQIRKEVTETDVLNRLFHWKSGNGILEHVYRLAFFRMSSICDPEPLITDQKLQQMVKGLKLRPLFVIDNVNKLDKKVIGQLLQTAKLFVDHRIGSFVFIISGGARGRDFVSDSAMSRVKKLHVTDFSKEETFQYLANQKWRGGENITGDHAQGGGDAEKIYEIVGGRLEHLVAVQDNQNIEEFQSAMKQCVVEKINGVNVKDWKAIDTIRTLSVLSAQRPLCPEADLYKSSGERNDRVEKMVEENLLQFNIEKRLYEFDSRLVEWYFENRHYDELVEA